MSLRRALTRIGALLAAIVPPEQGPVATARETAPHTRVVVALGMLVGVVFLPALLGRGFFFERDIHAYWYPHIEVAVRSVAEGSLPVWNPYTCFGRPLLADPNFQLLYPPTWWNLVLPPGTYYTAFVLLHCWAAGVGLYLLCRHHRLAPPAAATAAALWIASGPLVSSVNLFHHFAGAAWISWVLLAFARVTERPTARRALALGAGAGAQALAGSADMCLMSALAIGVSAAFALREGRPRWAAAVALVGSLALAAVFAALLAAAQWLPTIATLEAGSRPTLDLAERQFWSVHPASLIDLVAPGLLAQAAASPAVRAQVFEGRGPLLASLYLGMSSLPLVVLALLGRRHPLKLSATAGFVLFLAAALGRHAPIHAVLSAVPPYSMLRYPVKYMLPAALFWATLCGLGMDTLLRMRTSTERRRVRAAAAVAFGTCLASIAAALSIFWVHARGAAWPGQADLAGVGSVLGRSAAFAAGAGLVLVLRAQAGRRANLLAAAFAFLVLADIVPAGRNVNALAPPAALRYRPPLAHALRERGTDVRLWVHVPPTIDRAALLRGTRWDSPRGHALGARELLLPPIAASWGIAGSYDGDFTGMAPLLLGQLSALVHRLGDAHPVSLKLLQAGGVTHVASLAEPPLRGLRDLASFETVYGRPVRLFEVPDPLPRAYVLRAFGRRLDDVEAFKRFFADDFDPHREVMLPPEAAGTGDPGTDARTAARARRARIVARRMDALEIHAENDEAGWLVVLEGYDRGWTARVDGRAAPVHRANLLFCAVPLPAGTHRVELVYRAPLLRPGLALSVLAVAIGVAAVALPYARRPRNSRAG